jgi:hypothetical protein
MSDLLKLENIRKRNGDIRAFPLSSNLISSKTGSNGWGNVVVAINNQSSAQLFNDELIGILYLVNEREWKKEQEQFKIRPETVCLCGSTRFFKTFDEQNFKLTLEGKIVLSIGCNTKSDDGLKLTAEDKVMLDELHKRKIDLCDKVLVLNVDGYIGDSTRSEIAYALKIGKPVTYLFEELLPDYHPGD